MPKAIEPMTQFVPVNPNDGSGKKIPPIIRDGPHAYQGGIRIEYWQLTEEQKMDLFPERWELENKGK